jgi:RNA polymerase sigma factor (sigma-70 family)
MGATTLEPLLRYLRRLGPDGAAAGEDDDARLLARFVQTRDEEAFTALVRRHGPLVWGACTRLLPGSADAEDAFQATFLVLVRKARGLRRPERLGPWLYGVARRAALKVRSTAARRREQALGEATLADHVPPDAVWRDLRPVLDEEVGRLPEKYRTPFVLCYLQGLTNEEAARRLGCPTGTVLSRLSRARERLRGRLSRRGITLSSAALTSALAAGPGDAAVPAAVLTATVRAGLALASGTAAATTAFTLAEGVVHAMYLTKLKLAVVGLLALGLLGSGAGLLAHRTQAQSPPEAKSVATAPPPAKSVAPKPARADNASPGSGAESASRGPEMRDGLRMDFNFAGFDDPKLTLAEALDQLHKQYPQLNFDVNETAFENENLKDVLKTEIANPNPIPPMRGPVAAILRKILSRIPVGATYLIRPHAIEITTWNAMREELGVATRLPPPLVYEDFDEVPLTEALKKVTADSGMSLVMDKSALQENAAAVTVTARLHNVPVETAARLLADSVGLGVSLVGNVLYVTTREKAARMEQEPFGRLRGLAGQEDEAEKKPGRPSHRDAANPAAETGPAKRPANKDAGRRP